MFILTEWSIINMHDWVEKPLVVSDSKESLIDYNTREVGIVPLIDYTKNETLAGYCESRNLAENRCGHRLLTEFDFDYFLSIDTIRAV